MLHHPCGRAIAICISTLATHPDASNLVLGPACKPRLARIGTFGCPGALPNTDPVALYLLLSTGEPVAALRRRQNLPRPSNAIPPRHLHHLDFLSLLLRLRPLLTPLLRTRFLGHFSHPLPRLVLLCALRNCDRYHLFIIFVAYTSS